MLNLLFKLQFEDLEDDNNEIQRILDEKFYFNQHTYDESSLKHEASYLLEKIDIKCQDMKNYFCITLEMFWTILGISIKVVV